MGVSNPSRPKDKAAGPRAKAPVRPPDAYWISLSIREEAPPLAEEKGGRLVPTGSGRIVAECWRNLGEGRRALLTDVIFLEPHGIQGILRVKSSGRDGIGLADAVRLFKAVTARTLARAEDLRNRRAGGNLPVPPLRPAPLWKRGYGEKSLTGPSQIAAARKALKPSA
jgi:hypothetical protein